MLHELSNLGWLTIVNLVLPVTYVKDVIHTPSIIKIGLDCLGSFPWVLNVGVWMGQNMIYGIQQ